MHVLCHLRGIATHVEVRTVLQPCIQLAPVFTQALLHIDFFGRVTRKGEVELVQYAALQRGLPLGLVQEIL